MMMEIMRCCIERQHTLHIDLWDQSTMTNIELYLTTPTLYIEDLRQYLLKLSKEHTKIDSVRLMILHTLLQRDHADLYSALIKIGDIT